MGVVGLTPDSNRFADKLVTGGYNTFQKVMQFMWPHGVGACIYCKKIVFDKTGGFDHSITLAEDHDFVKRASKHGKFRVIPRHKIVYSMRRYHEDGHFNMALWCVQAEFDRIFKGEVRHNKNKYVDRKKWLEKVEKKP